MMARAAGLVALRAQDRGLEAREVGLVGELGAGRARGGERRIEVLRQEEGLGAVPEQRRVGLAAGRRRAREGLRGLGETALLLVGEAQVDQEDPVVAGRLLRVLARTLAGEDLPRGWRRRPRSRAAPRRS